MYIDHVSLLNYRTYALLNLPLHSGATVFLGPNGVGKTNIVEAIDYTANLKSHRVSNDGPLVRMGSKHAYIRTRVLQNNQQTVTEFEITPGQSNRVRINRAGPVAAREALGISKTVLFSPEDLSLIKADPSFRRRYLDDLAVALRPAVAAYRSDYDRLVRQRNSLLKIMRTKRYGLQEKQELEVWNQQLSEAGANLLLARLKVLLLLSPHIQRAYAELTDASKQVELSYESTVFPLLSGDFLKQAASLNLEQMIATLLDEYHTKQAEEIERGMSLVGPHRDEINIDLGSLPARGFASHGETWSLALSLRLGSWYLHCADQVSPGLAPILILDDVFAELDRDRRRRLGSLVSEAEQVLVTSAVPSDIPAELGDPAYIQVSSGRAEYINE